MLCLRRLSYPKPICNRFIGIGYDGTANSGDPDMSKDLLFDENFNVREKVVLKKWNPMYEFFFRNSWKVKQKLAVWFGGPIPEIKSKEEVKERNELMHRLEEFYLEIPQRFPDQKWFEDLIIHYTKYHDYEGADNVWKWFSQHDIWINMDQNILDKWEKFFELHDPVSMTKESPLMAERRLQLLAKFKQMDDNPERWYKHRQLNIQSPEKPGTFLPEGDRAESSGGY